MKKTILSLLLLFIFTKTTNAQVVIDTVSIGAGYANQTWYSLENDEQGSSPKNNWDIAFDVSGFGSSIHINSVTGTTLWKYPTAGISGWATLDTTGISAWPTLYNSDTSWAIGAFDRGIVPSNPFDLGWGVYNSTTHIVSADSLFVIKLANGMYKKLWIENLASGTYTFKYADINGANLQTASLSKSTYTGKLFGYYSLQNNTAVNREPVPSANWDLLFTQYTTFIPTLYTVTGVLSNNDVTVAEVINLGNAINYNNWSSHSFVTPINEIGYDWKTFTGVWSIEDSLVYFVNSKQGDIWKLVFTGFGGSGNGNFIFSKEKISTVGIDSENNNMSSSLTVYPNPASKENVHVIYNFQKYFSKTTLNVYDLTGRTVHSEILLNATGLHTHQLNLSNLNSGVYIIAIDMDGNKMQQKLIIQ